MTKRAVAFLLVGLTAAAGARAADDGSQLQSPFRINYLGYFQHGPKVALFLSAEGGRTAVVAEGRRGQGGRLRHIPRPRGRRLRLRRQLLPDRLLVFRGHRLRPPPERRRQGVRALRRHGGGSLRPAGRRELRLLQGPPGAGDGLREVPPRLDEGSHRRSLLVRRRRQGQLPDEHGPGRLGPHEPLRAVPRVESVAREDDALRGGEGRRPPDAPAHPPGPEARDRQAPHERAGVGPVPPARDGAVRLEDGDEGDVRDGPHSRPARPPPRRGEAARRGATGLRPREDGLPERPGRAAPLPGLPGLRRRGRDLPRQRRLRPVARAGREARAVPPRPGQHRGRRLLGPRRGVPRQPGAFRSRHRRPRQGGRGPPAVR